MRPRIIVIEDEALIAAEIRFSLENLGYDVVGHAMNGDKALDLFARTPADLILLDICIKGTLSGIDLARVINDKYKLPFVYLTSFSDPLTLEKVKETSPYGYIVKPFNQDDLRVNIELALFKFNSNASNNGDLTKEQIEAKLNVRLTDREYAVLSAFKDGLSYKETGEKLFISVNTVKSYQKRLYAQLGVTNKYELNQLIARI